MSYKIKSKASRLGLRDGKDASLLGRPLNNPYDPFSTEFGEYENAWYQGYEEEENSSL
jgi:hypothetical protein